MMARGASAGRTVRRPALAAGDTAYAEWRKLRLG